MKEKLKELCDAYCMDENGSELLYGELLNLFSVSGSTLPTDTDIKQEAKKHAEWDDGTTYQSSMYGFESGAKWMRNKLK
jgi:hypothetical protein